MPTAKQATPATIKPAGAYIIDAPMAVLSIKHSIKRFAITSRRSAHFWKRVMMGLRLEANVFNRLTRLTLVAFELFVWKDV